MSDNLYESLDSDLGRLEGTFRDCSDIVFRRFLVGDDARHPAAVVFVDGMVDRTFVSDNILSTLMIEVRKVRGVSPGRLVLGNLHDLVVRSLVTAGEVRLRSTFSEVVNGILAGEVALLLDGFGQAIMVSAKEWEKRGITEPLAESIVRGPREGFEETIRINTSLLRRKIRTPRLKIVSMELGTVAKTFVAVCYIEGIAHPNVVAEVMRRLARIQIDGVLESGYIEEFIEDNPLSPFPSVGRTERPDKVAAALLEGRVAILVDGTPFALTVPLLFVELLQSNEDYYDRPFIATMLRLLRAVAIVIALVLPGFYVAIVTFHQEMIPTGLALSIAASRTGVPFPALLETLLMEVAFEILREAGVRLPRPIGQAVSIVGALVIGDAAVRAGLVSTSTVIVVATTGIASFAIPGYPLGISIRVSRFLLTLLAGPLGLFGLSVGVGVLMTHVVSLKSFGVPYTWPLVPLGPDGLKDTVVRVPWPLMTLRPAAIATPGARRRLRSPGSSSGPRGSRPGGG